MWRIALPMLLVCLLMPGCQAPGLDEKIIRYGFTPSVGKYVAVGQVWSLEHGELTPLADAPSDMRRFISRRESILFLSPAPLVVLDNDDLNDPTLVALREAGATHMTVDARELWIEEVSLFDLEKVFGESPFRSNPNAIVVTSILRGNVEVQVSPSSPSVRKVLVAAYPQGDIQELSGVTLRVLTVNLPIGYKVAPLQGEMQ